MVHMASYWSQQSRWLPQIGTKRTSPRGDHRNHDNALMYNLSPLLPPSNINLPLPNLLSSLFNFSFVNDTYLTACRWNSKLIIILRRRRVSAGGRSWHHDKDDKYHSCVSNTLFHCIRNLRTHSNIANCSTIGQSGSAKPWWSEWSSDLDDIFGIVDNLLSVGIASQLTISNYHDYLPSNAHFDRTLPSLSYGKWRLLPRFLLYVFLLRWYPCSPMLMLFNFTQVHSLVKLDGYQVCYSSISWFLSEITPFGDKFLAGLNECYHM